MLKKRNVVLTFLCGVTLCGVVAISQSDAQAARKEKVVKENLYDKLDSRPLELSECARCHASHFKRIKGNGARHAGVACTDCHEQFHAYNPLKNNYAEIMPKCSQCHDNPHGTAPDVTKCLTCHQDPHQPLNSIPDPGGLEKLCATCHANIAAMLKQKPSKHTLQKCSACHSKKHGRIPECFECHKNHSPQVDMKTPDCLACHPVHTPKQISFPVTQSKELCGGCHQVPYNQLKENKTKHSELTCAKCHPSHGEIPPCQRCHGDAPHDASIHQKFAKCGMCHTIAHNLRK